jgi:AcrR family transcriptional regulator
MEAGRGAVGRGPKLRAAVLEATAAELAERGYAALTVESVARRAGVHKTSIYRRWGDRESLVVDALSERIAANIPIPDTGTIAADLRELARGLMRWLASPAGQTVLAVLLSDAVRLPDIAASRRRIFADRLRRAEPVVRRAVARGELPADTDPSQIFETLAAPLYFRVIVTAEPIDEAVADRAAGAALAAARAGVLQRLDEAPAG